MLLVLGYYDNAHLNCLMSLITSLYQLLSYNMYKSSQKLDIEGVIINCAEQIQLMFYKRGCNVRLSFCCHLNLYDQRKIS